MPLPRYEVLSMEPPASTVPPPPRVGTSGPVHSLPPSHHSPATPPIISPRMQPTATLDTVVTNHLRQAHAPHPLPRQHPQCRPEDDQAVAAPTHEVSYPPGV